MLKAQGTARPARTDIGKIAESRKTRWKRLRRYVISGQGEKAVSEPVSGQEALDKAGDFIEDKVGEAKDAASGAVDKGQGHGRRRQEGAATDAADRAGRRGRCGGQGEVGCRRQD